MQFLCGISIQKAICSHKQSLLTTIAREHLEQAIVIHIEYNIAICEYLIDSDLITIFYIFVVKNCALQYAELLEWFQAGKKYINIIVLFCDVLILSEIKRA